MRFTVTIAVTLVFSALGLPHEISAGRVLAPLLDTSLPIWNMVNPSRARGLGPIVRIGAWRG